MAAGDEHALEALEALRTAPPVNGDHGHNWGVNEYISRGISGQENYMNAYRNAARAYQCALLWKIRKMRAMATCHRRIECLPYL